MKTLIINGSPRAFGDTVALLEILKENLAGDCFLIDAYHCNIAACVDCRYCRSHPGCAVEDGMQKVYDYIRDCDNAVIASPIYFSELTGKVLDLCSRLQTFFSARAFRGEIPDIAEKRGAVILVGGGNGAPDKAFSTARTLLKSMNCREIHPLVCFHDTDHRRAAEDECTVAGVKNIAAFLNRNA